MSGGKKNIPSFIAGRYLRSKGARSVVNLISKVSAVSVAVPVAAMVILLSVFNGFETMIRSMYSHFDPEVVVNARQGKSFVCDSVLLDRIASCKGVAGTALYLDESAMMVYNGRQYIGTVRGVDSNFEKVVPIKQAVDMGKFEPMFGDVPQCLVGNGVAYNLGIHYAVNEPIALYVPRRGGAFSTLIPWENFRHKSINPSGIYTIDMQTDSEFIIAPLGFVRELADNDDRVTGVMVSAKREAGMNAVRDELKSALGDDFTVRNRYEQKASLYRVMVNEKWGIFFIILLVLIISSFATVGSLGMRIIDKQDDIFTLSVIGAPNKTIREIFVRHAMMVSMIGSLGGLIFGVLISLGQQHLGLLKMPSQSFLMESYPVLVKFSDIIIVALSFTLINYIIIKFTASIILKKRENPHEGE